VRDTTQVRYAREGHIARLTFDRAEVLNALSPTLIDEALHVAEEVAASDARVLILSGAGKAFSAGVDLKAVSLPEHTREVAAKHTEQARALILMLETMPQATIAQISGYCFTGGLEIALGCDLLVAADDAIFCDTHAKLGIRPGWGLAQRLPRRVGVMRAREMSFTGRRVDAAEAVRIGLVIESAPKAELESRVTAIAEQIAAQNPNSIAAYKGLYRISENMGLDDGLAFEPTFRAPRRDAGPRVPLSSHLKSS
jgi:enoyl-CoA hydratase